MGTKLWAGICLAVLTASHASAQGALSAIDFEGTLTIRIGERPVAVYVYEDENVLRPYFRDLLTVSGACVQWQLRDRFESSKWRRCRSTKSRGE